MASVEDEGDAAAAAAAAQETAADLAEFTVEPPQEAAAGGASDEGAAEGNEVQEGEADGDEDDIDATNTRCFRHTGILVRFIHLQAVNGSDDEVQCKLLLTAHNSN